MMLHLWINWKQILFALFLSVLMKSCISLNNIEFAAKREIDQINTNSVISDYNQRSDTFSSNDDDIHVEIADSLDKENIKENSRSYSEYPHHSGSDRNIKLGEKIARTWEDYGLDKVDKFNYDVLLTNTDKPAEIILTDDEKVVKLLVVVDEPAFENNASTTEPTLFPFAAFSRGGSIERQIVYCNYGNKKDYELLLKLNIVLKDKIFLIRWGASELRSSLTKRAIKYGGAALIIFTDPADYSYPGEEYPNGWMSSRFGIQRGSIGTSAKYLGDLLSEGYPSKHGYFREKILNVKKYLHKIAVQPISSFLAQELFDFMDDDSITVPKNFQGGLKVRYNLQTKGSKKVTLKVYNELKVNNILVVCGTMYGKEEPDRYILIGNHRDAWVYGTADPVSGTAIISEIARVLGKRRSTYRPRRSVMLCSWDGEESGSLGSVEWAEEHISFISKKVVSYLNVDISVDGNYTVRLKSSPLLAKSIFGAARKVVSPNDEEITLYQDMCHRHAVLKDSTEDLQEPDYNEGATGSSDTRIFVSRFSLPVSDYRYTYSSKDFPTLALYPQYHTSYDNFRWMSKFIDPTFKYHLAIGKLWLLHTLSLADNILLPFDLATYADHLEKAFLKLEKKYEELLKKNDVDFEPIKKSINLLNVKIYEFNKAKDKLDFKKLDPIILRLVNDVISNFGRQFAQTGSMKVVYKEGRFDTLKKAIEFAHGKKGKVGVNIDKWDAVRKELTLILWCIDTVHQSLDLSELSSNLK